MSICLFVFLQRRLLISSSKFLLCSVSLSRFIKLSCCLGDLKRGQGERVATTINFQVTNITSNFCLVPAIIILCIVRAIIKSENATSSIYIIVIHYT